MSPSHPEDRAAPPPLRTTAETDERAAPPSARAATGGYVARLADAALGRRHPFVLCYHGVSLAPPRPDPAGLFVSDEQFEAHLDLIEDRGYRLVAVSELWRLMQAGADVSRYASITFDDGFAATVRTAMPILARRGSSCSMFVITGLLGQPHPRLPGERIATGEELLQLAEAGFEIGAHTVDHPHLTGLSYNAALDQLRHSRESLESLLDRPVRTMAYPFGAFNEQTMRAAAEAGYEIACGCAGPAPWRALALPREPVFPGTTMLQLRVKIAGLFGPVHASRALRMRLRRRGPAGERNDLAAPEARA
jgi:peptidoglycan/xylan/chitin deacetylase (PgdA/CDA1 family)